MPLQSTLQASSGYKSDISVPRCSGCITTAACKAPGMIWKDKRVQSESIAASESQTLESNNNKPVIMSSTIRKIAPIFQKQSTTTSSPVKNSAGTQRAAWPSQHRNAEAEKSLTLATNACTVPDLNQDSDDENKHVRK
ncbi:uncharacterized protein MELLADRAFT_105712 [Melampsora larici-populina 98AG31]|uniref:Uncharacterized protein n=1 Tax=Melampsora larici-populina (strain 98AG31 / pathotype 3-4-7) TaxID=747676 RepID=F4RJ45_MELLP|nr:uncharacterized protein MELLADRAFT_105712 [Melampsora larici-populina 98AG31]EGG07669.1 hypothetical protein MELLADRAFT_105712 [Melampsora larici-populina 98AG31]